MGLVGLRSLASGLIFSLLAPVPHALVVAALMPVEFVVSAVVVLLGACGFVAWVVVLAVVRLARHSLRGCKVAVLLPNDLFGLPAVFGQVSCAIAVVALSGFLLASSAFFGGSTQIHRP